MAYRENIRHLKDTNLTEVGLLYSVDWDQLDCDQKYLLSDYENCLLDKFTVDEYGLWEEAEFVMEDEEERKMIFDEVIKDAPYYLVMAHNCTWTGASGYTFAETKAGAFYRSYDASIYPRNVSRNGKVLSCIEASHDVPGGAVTTVIALTNREYSRLHSADWDIIEDFVTKMEALA